MEKQFTTKIQTKSFISGVSYLYYDIHGLDKYLGLQCYFGNFR